MNQDRGGVSSKIVRIGNSQGVRIPKPLLEQAGLTGPVRLRVVESGILIERRPVARNGWDEAAQRMRDRGETGMLDEPTGTEFDQTDWTWE